MDSFCPKPKLHSFTLNCCIVAFSRVASLHVALLRVEFNCSMLHCCKFRYKWRATLWLRLLGSVHILYNADGVGGGFRFCYTVLYMVGGWF